MCRDVPSRRPQQNCPGCEDRFHLEWRSPGGPIVTCSTCGAHYRRTKDASAAADQLLDGLLIEDQSKLRFRPGE